jgi:hypothetical protein
MLQQLGIDSSAALWALTQSAKDCPLKMASAAIAGQLIGLARAWLNMCKEGQECEFMPSSRTHILAELQELQQQLQQQLQLLMLFPAVLLQWAVDLEVTSRGSLPAHEEPQYSFNCVLAFWESCGLLDTYNQVLRDSPASVYQHLTGQKRPQTPPGASLRPGMPAFFAQVAAPRVRPKVRVPLPADVYTGLLQVLDELLPTLLLLWGKQVGVVEAAGNEPTGSSKDAASSTGGRGDRGSSCGNRRAASGSSSSSGGDVLLDLEQVVSSAGDLLLQMVEQFPATLMDPTGDMAGSSSSAAATAAAAGQLCALLERMRRTEMCVTRHFSALKAAGPHSSSSSSKTSYLYGREPDHLYNVSNNLITWKLVAAFVDDPTLKVAPVIDPIITHSSPGSQPSRPGRSCDSQSLDPTTRCS